MKRGFTLTELLAVIVIIGIVTGITIPIITGSINNSKIKAYDEQVRLIVDAGRNYMSKHPQELPNSSSTKISVATLKNEGYLDNKTIKNPKDNEEMKGCVKITYQNNKYVYNYESTC